MKIWDDEKKTFIQDTSLSDINTGLTFAEKLLRVIKSTPLGNGTKNNLIKKDLLIEIMRQETAQKDKILDTIIKLRELDALSPEEFKLMMLAYTSTVRF